MSLETSRHGLQLEIPRPGLVQFAERLVFPNHPGRDHADGGLVSPRLAAVRSLERGAAVRHRVSEYGRAPRHPCLHHRTRIHHPRLADSADAIDLSPDVEL